MVLKVLLDIYCEDELRNVFHSPLFEIVSQPNRADVVIFQRHDFLQLQQSQLFQNNKSKSITLSQTDRPGFFVPGIYSSNYVHPLSRTRAKTYSYFYQKPGAKNRYIEAYRNKSLPKKYLFSFIGGCTAPVRHRLIDLYEKPSDSFCVENTTSLYSHWCSSANHSQAQRHRQESYVLNVKESLFYLCPRGAGHGSIRLFEVMELGTAPVIIADGWIPPDGPDWEEFAIFVPEKDIAKLEEILEQHRDRAKAMGIKAKQAFETYFADDRRAAELHRLIQEIMTARDERYETFIRSIFPLFYFNSRAKESIKTLAKYLLKLAGLRR